MLSAKYRNDVNLEYHRNEAMRSACQYGHTEVVKVLVRETRADPRKAVYQAIEDGHVQIYTYKTINQH